VQNCILGVAIKYSFGFLCLFFFVFVFMFMCQTVLCLYYFLPETMYSFKQVLECSFALCKKRILRSDNRDESQDGMKRCGKCRTSYYCSNACQKSDWSFHKLVCKRNDYGKKICQFMQKIFFDLLQLPDYRHCLLSQLTVGDVFPEVILEYTGESDFIFSHKNKVTGALAAAALETVFNKNTDFSCPSEIVHVNVFKGPLFAGSLSQTPGQGNCRVLVITFLYSDVNDISVKNDSRSCVRTSIEIPRPI
jgi:hypothetical protein